MMRANAVTVSLPFTTARRVRLGQWEHGSKNNRTIITKAAGSLANAMFEEENCLRRGGVDREKKGKKDAQKQKWDNFAISSQRSQTCIPDISDFPGSQPSAYYTPVVAFHSLQSGKAGAPVGTKVCVCVGTLKLPTIRFQPEPKECDFSFKQSNSSSSTSDDRRH